ncbi:1,4-dihydroxy-2-naphthoate polyprenyltransferase [Tenggerimyces flavus]|uniref:1,4-dihydroxy-2-naphthoate octaprenyltransferase n=1 Tax=Tenggerimyces flavus TaxID=1708749 RepID=A0ABV7Y4V3_9ACTN|nr:1,4-dihydroxy-2-naphthoate polyprenyltransferase [Tenggerimyces flavus]MBM7791225.1 1,4-dihydroxy-2-naphthoate octaprenyltransferase [Tenggerimyces flavus]
MATPGEWFEGARLRTWSASIAPVLVGSGAAAAADGFVWWKALLALVVSVAIQVGCNYANDYSDGIRGTDDQRVGPLRLVGSGVATPTAVRTAAFVCFAVAAVAGLVLALTSAIWLIAVGAVAIAAAWFYTGGDRPYGYRALGEVSVFVFFGLVAVLGTTFVQVGGITWPSVAGAIAVGALTCSLLVANNVRDIPTDAESGKRTLAVVMGDGPSRQFYVGLQALGYVAVVVLAVTTSWWVLLALLALPLAIRPIRIMLSGITGRALIPVLRDTGVSELAFSALLTVGLVLAA